MTETVVCVGAVVRRSKSALLVRQSPGHPLGGKWTIPWGQVDPGESPTAAVLREIEEEAGIVARVEGLLGVQELPAPWIGMLGILFVCTHARGTPVADMRETDAADYFDAARLDDIAATLEPLSGWLVPRVLADDVSILPMNALGPYAPSPTYL